MSWHVSGDVCPHYTHACSNTPCAHAHTLACSSSPLFCAHTPASSPPLLLSYESCVFPKRKGQTTAKVKLTIMLPVYTWFMVQLHGNQRKACATDIVTSQPIHVSTKCKLKILSTGRLAKHPLWSVPSEQYPNPIS